MLALISQYIVIILLYILRLDSQVPNLNSIRTLRLFRLVKIARYSSAFQALIISVKQSGSSLIAVLLLFFMSVIIFGSIEFYAERGTLDENNNYVRPDGTLSPFGNIMLSCWWAVVTLATLGYGDIFPITIAGKIIGTIAVITGLLLIALPSMIIGKTFNQLKDEHEAKQSFTRERSKTKNNHQVLTRDHLITMVQRQDEIVVQLQSMTDSITGLMDEVIESRKKLAEYLIAEKTSAETAGARNEPGPEPVPPITEGIADIEMVVVQTENEVTQPETDPMPK
jgi:methyl-accepting chemotaxis protein